ncbi:MAG TPA: efflux RND transporter permease subunit [bacterium]|nr:efflux RND transporter permease subunit [bacterium]
MFLSKLSIKNHVLVVMVTLALILFGLIAVKTLGVELIPSVDVPVVTVTTIYPGADAKTIEEEVVKKVEDEIGILNGIDQLKSIVVDNVGIVVVKFKDGVKTDTAVQDVRDKVEFVKKSLPDDVETPVVEKMDVNANAFLSIILKAPAGENLSVVTEIARKKIKERISAISGVGKVEMYGGREREIKILLDPLKMGSQNIPPIALVQMIKSASIKIPAGSIKMKEQTEDVSVKADGTVETVNELSEIPLIKNSDGSTLKVRDFARVVDGLQEEESASFLDLTPAIGMDVKKQGKVNVVALAKNVKSELKKIKKELPDGYSVEVIGDTTPFTEGAVSGSNFDIFLGAILAMIVVLLFLMNKRAALIILVSLPTSIIGTFFFVKAMGFSLNFMTTLALSLSVGLLTDDAIVVIEAIVRHLKEGKSKIKAAVEATDEVGLAVISAELALISVFGPTTTMDGVVGQIFKEFGITVVIAILISLVVSFTLTPLLSSFMLKNEKSGHVVFKLMEKLLLKLETAYSKAVLVVLKYRMITFITAIGLFTLGILAAGQLKTEFMPMVDMGVFTIKFELPPETSIERSKEVTREVIETISEFNWEKNAYSSIGASSTKEKSVITVKVTLNDSNNRKISTSAAVDETRKKLSYMKEKYDAEIYFLSRDESMAGGSPIELNLLGDDFETLDRAGETVIEFMKKDGGFADIMSNNKGFKKELKIRFDHSKMTDLGVNSAESVATLRYLISGVKVSEMDNPGGEKDEIKVYLDDPYKDIEHIKNIPLRSNSMQGIKLSDVADLSYGSAIVKINRYNKRRNIAVTASVAPGYDLGNQMSKLKAFASGNLPAGVSFEEGGDAEMMSESFQSLIMALLIAVFLIYIVLASQFNSFIHPFTIMSALPFAMTGAMLTLYFTKLELSVLSFIGIIMLMGIVTKNSILLVDYSLKMIRNGFDVQTALVKACKTRLRPIIMTTGATIMGMIPVVVSAAEGAEMKRSMGWAVMGGLIFSTMVTLFIVPVIFSYFNKFTAKRNIEREKEIAAM